MTVTNAMRLLKQAGIEFDTSTYEVDESDLSGVHLAEVLGVDVDCVFKTLVVRSDKRNLYVFCIPAAQELDLKKCASVTGEKKLEMVQVKELLGLTGYIRGGCSPIGMKKRFPTYFHSSALLFDTIYVSAGVRGLQIEISPAELISFVGGEVGDVATFAGL
jgi:Cys-tRNA(Pro)/Cys-tRNA(Cys) deacylase